jgi:hypothetical protein
MKNFYPRKLLLLLILICLMQNNAILLPDPSEDVYSGEEFIAPQNDTPDYNNSLT